MLSHTIVRSTIARLVLVITLLAILIGAKPVVEKRAEQSSSLSNSTFASTTTTRHSTSLTSTETATSSLTASSSSSTAGRPANSFPTQNARIAGSTSGPLGTFCRQFVKECYTIALGGQRGEVTVSHSCERNGGKYSTSFTYSCYRGTERLTPRVLKAMGQAFHRPSTTTIEEDKVVTEVIERVTTAFDVSTRTTTSTAATVTSRSSTTVVEVDIRTVPSTIISTTIIPYTVSTTTSTTRTQVTTATSTVTLTTATEVFIGTAEIPVYQAVVNDPQEDVQRRAPSTFCLAFRIACQNECQRVDSRDDVEICDSSRSPVYTMACICKNGKRETQHALEAVAEDRKVVSITKTSTSTTYLTSTRTTTLPTEVVRTRLVTRTSLLRGTYTSHTTTTTISETTQYTGRSSTVATDIITMPTTTTTTTTTTVQVPTTTRIVLAETGYIHGFGYTTGEDLGTIGAPDISGFVPLLPPRSTEDTMSFMAVRDPASGLYQLAQLGSPTQVLMRGGDTQDPVFRSGTAQYAFFQLASSAVCGANANKAGPWDPTTARCETFIFSPLALDPTPGATDDTVNMQPLWINSVNSNPANHSGAWGFFATDRVLTQIADPVVFTRFYPSAEIVFGTLRFPFSET